MAVFHAFRALRPTPEKAADVAALPYDVVNREEAKSIGDENPLSFLHIDRPEMDLEPETDLYDDRVYEKAKENLDNMEEKGILVQDQKACYYIYELVRKGKTQTGIVGCSSIDDYMNGVVKKHELTREDKEQDRIHHVDSCNANTGPIFLACRYPDSLLTLMNNWKDHHEAAYDFTEEDQITHSRDVNLPEFTPIHTVLYQLRPHGHRALILEGDGILIFPGGGRFPAAEIFIDGQREARGAVCHLRFIAVQNIVQYGSGAFSRLDLRAEFIFLLLHEILYDFPEDLSGAAVVAVETAPAQSGYPADILHGHSLKSLL